MEDVDKIIIQTLRTLACDLDDSIKSLSQFSTELVVYSIVKCLKAINPSVVLSETLPPVIPARFKLGTDLTQHCKDLGFKGDLNFGTFLYGNVVEIRNVFLFLLEKLPKTEAQPLDQTPERPEDLRASIRKRIFQELSRPWLPTYCSNETCFPFSTRDDAGTKLDLIKPRETRGFSAQDFNVPGFKFIPAVLHRSDAELAAEKDKFEFQECKRRLPVETSHVAECDSRFSLSAFLQHQKEQETRKMKPELPPKPSKLVSPAVKNADEEAKHEEELREKLREEISQMVEACHVHEEELPALRSQISALKRTIEEQELRNRNEEKSLEKDEKILLLLEDSQSHIERLSSLLEANRKKMEQMETQWNDIKQTMDEEYQTALKNRTKGDSWKLREKIKSLKEKLEEVVVETETKESHIQQLQMQVGAVPESSIRRSYYTQRIMAVVASLRKQNEEMQRVLDDIKSVQREINSLQGKVDRTFIVTDEIIFKEAKADEVAKRIYKLLVALHSECEDILKLIDETAAASRESRDLEERVQVQKRKNVAASLQKILADLKEMRQENEQLESQLV